MTGLRYALVGSTILLISHAAQAQDLEIPNVFQPGQPARAGEVNDNFSAVKTAVDENSAVSQGNADTLDQIAADLTDNTSSIQANTDAIAALASSGLYVQVSGQNIGLFVAAPSATESSLYTGYWTVLSSTALLFQLTASASQTGTAGELRRETIHFSDPGCAGQAYFRTEDPDRAAQLAAGFVAASRQSSNPVPVWYSTRGANVLDPNVIAAAIEYEYQPSGCVFSGAPPAYYIEVQPNDVNETGIQDQRDFGSGPTLSR